MSEALMTAKVLRRAAELVDQGWCQFASARGAQGFRTFATDCHAERWCMWGAIQRAEVEVTGRRISCWLGGVYARPDWNDAPERTADEVSAELRRMADEVEARAAGEATP